MLDVVVVGSGAAGMAAALAAAEAGANVTVLERHTHIGGTTALSGGLAWLPANPLDPDDSPEQARTYLRSLEAGDVDDDLSDVFCREAGPTARWVEASSPIRWQTVPYPDYHAERPGGRLVGRSVEPAPLPVPVSVRDRIRTAPNLRAMITYRELATGSIDRDELARRDHEGVITMGRGLVAGLAMAFGELGGVIRTEVRVTGLRTSGKQIVGVTAGDEEFDGNVVLASGGFERDPALAASFLAGPMLAPTGAPWAEGDGLRMAMAAGAELGNMSQAWWCPAFTVPGEAIDGRELHRLVLTERARPGTIMVDGEGRRFVDEAQNYNDLGRSLLAFDPSTFTHPRIPSWLIFDDVYRKENHFGPLRSNDPDPEWLYRADTTEELAGILGIPSQRLVETLDRFNRYAEVGEDPDFGRGTFAYDRHVAGVSGFAGSGPGSPAVRAVDHQPFYAVKIVPGCLGTKGGPRIDQDGRVRHIDGGVIGGLFAAGNVSANPFGYAYPGAGGTIGPALVFGRRAGKAVVNDKN